jgi:hypothetical protein
MSCEHEVRFTIKPTDDACRFHFDVRAYKDRIVAPDEYSGATEVTPSDQTQTLQTKDKLVRDDITINPAPTEYLSTDHNGTFTPSDGRVGFSQVSVDVQPDLRPLSVSENGTYHPDGLDGYSEVIVDVPNKVLISESVLERDVFDNNARESYWVENFIPVDQNEDNLYEIVFQNNTAPTRTAVRIISPGRKLDTFSSANGCFLWRMSDGVVQRYCTTFDMNYHSGTARFLNASAGTTVKVYKLR